MTKGSEYPGEIAITPFDPHAGIRFKCGRVFCDRESEIREFQEAIGFELPPDFVDMIGEYCEGSFGGDYRVHIKDDAEVWWTHLLFMKIAARYDEFFGHDAIALLHSVPEMFFDAKGLRFLPFGDACTVSGKGMAKGFLVFEAKHRKSVAFIPYGRGKRIRIASSFREMMLASSRISYG